MSNICPVLAEETCCLIAFLNNFNNGSNIVNDRVLAWTRAYLNSEPHWLFKQSQIIFRFSFFQMLLFSYILKMLCKLNPILTYEKVTTCFTYIEWVSGWVCVCVCAGGGGCYNHSHPKRERAFYQRMVMMYQPLLLLERRYLNLHWMSKL